MKREVAVKYMVVAIFTISCFPLYAAPEHPDFDPDAISSTDVAKQWVNSLLKGEIEKTMSLSTTPFEWDKKTVWKTKKDLKVAFEEVVAGKGKRDIPISQAKQVTVDDQGNVEVEVLLGKDKVRVLLKNLKVVGFRD